REYRSKFVECHRLEFRGEQFGIFVPPRFAAVRSELCQLRNAEEPRQVFEFPSRTDGYVRIAQPVDAIGSIGEPKPDMRISLDICPSCPPGEEMGQCLGLQIDCRCEEARFDPRPLTGCKALHIGCKNAERQKRPAVLTGDR